MRTLFDLHNHTSGSFDSSESPAALFARAQELEIRGLAITDHDVLTVPRHVPDDVIWIPGMEISVEDPELNARVDHRGRDIFHLLAIGITEEVPLGLGAEETCEWIHDLDGVVVVAHPFASHKHYPAANDRVYEILDFIDGIEVTNPKGIVDNRKARKLAKTFNRARVGGSDAHSADRSGVGVTKCNEVDSLDELLRAIRKRDTDGHLRHHMLR